MDLLKTLLVYMTMVYASSVQSMPDAEAYMATVSTPTPAVTATAEPTPRPTAVPTVEVSVNPDYHTIQTGDKGDEVLRLQQALAEYGYYEGELDGRFGQQTRRAVERFQYSHGLTADGIAGRNTLSVLYDSGKVRRADYWQSSVTPTPSPSPTPSPTDTPVPSPSPTAAPTDTPAPAVAATEAPVTVLEPMEGWIITVDGQTVLGENEAALPPCRSEDGALYLPLREILLSHGVTILPSDSMDNPGYAFALGGSLYRLSYGLNQAGTPIHLEITLNGVRQLLKVRDIRAYGEGLYIPAETIDGLLGISAAEDESGSAVTVTFPADE